MNVSILLAGGTGSRLGAGQPKQFVELLGKPMIVYAMEIYEHSPLIDAIEVVCVPEYMEQVWELARQYNIHKLKWVCEGGSSCQESTAKGLFHLEGVLQDSDFVSVNMSSSIFVSEEILADSFAVAKKRGSAFACMRCIYNNAESADGISSAKINFKENNYTLNMPWTSSFGKLDAMYRKAFSEDIETGEASYMPTLFLALGEPLYFSRDDGLNKIHITRQADIEIATAILFYRNSQEKGN